MLATAAAEPGTLVIGLDADASRMVEASRRASRNARGGGLGNAIFVAAAAESLPPELDGLVDAVTVHLPWGSLLRGAMAPEPWFLDAIRRICRPGARLTLLVSLDRRDRLDLPDLTPDTLARLASRYVDAGFRPLETRLATTADIRASHSSWAKRLAADPGRRSWLLRFERRPMERAAKMTTCASRERSTVSAGQSTASSTG